MDLDEAVLCRLSYAPADQLHEANDANISGRWRSNPAAGGTLEQIVAEVVRRHAVAPEAVELVRVDVTGRFKTSHSWALQNQPAFLG
jgi:hypothetical protein